jgi:iron(III) transport system ATP-binding protein
VSLYNAPRTRFVAGFIGRTNFLDGTAAGGTIGFPGFAVPADGISDGAVSFSVRPQNITLHHAAPVAANGSWQLQGIIAERAYLGESWEYVVRPTDSDLRLRVSTSPHIACSVGDAVWLEIDPRRAARVPSAE